MTYKAYPPTSIVYAGGIIKNNMKLTLEDSRVFVQALAESAPRLAEMGIGGGFHTSYGPNRTDITFILANGTKEEIEEGWYCVRLP